MTPAERIIRSDMQELMRSAPFRRFLLRWFKAGLLDTIAKGTDARSLEYREGGRAVVMGQLLEAQGSMPGDQIEATLIQILSEADQTARKEIARGGRDLNDGNDGDPTRDDDGRVD